MRRFVLLALMALMLALLASGCFPLRGPSGPSVEEYYGLRVVSLRDSDPPPPEMYDPFNPPVLAAIVHPAPLIDPDDYDRCEDLLADPFFYRMCAANWERVEVQPGQEESVSIVLLNGSEATRFRLVFAGHRPGEVAEGVAISREYVAPPNWSGMLEFPAVPVYPPFTRLFFVQIQWRHADGGWGASPQPIYFAPCPADYPWSPDAAADCDAIAR